MKAPVTVRLTKLVTSQIFDYFLSNEHTITMYENLYLSYPVNAVALVDGHRIYAAGQKAFNGYLASDIIGKTGYDNPLILHVQPVMPELQGFSLLPVFRESPVVHVPALIPEPPEL